MEWQPIETAPKDGTFVLIFWPNYAYDVFDPFPETVIDIGWYVTNSRISDMIKANPDETAKRGISSDSYFTNTGEWDCYGLACDENKPTHWMPLPEPPKQTPV